MNPSDANLKSGDFKEESLISPSDALLFGEVAIRIAIPRQLHFRKLYCAATIISDTTIVATYTGVSARFEMAANAQGREVLKWSWPHNHDSGIAVQSGNQMSKPFGMRPGFRLNLRDVGQDLHNGNSLTMTNDGLEQSFRIAAGIALPVAKEAYLACSPIKFAAEVDEIVLKLPSYTTGASADLVIMYVGCLSSADPI